MRGDSAATKKQEREELSALLEELKARRAEGGDPRHRAPGCPVRNPGTPPAGIPGSLWAELSNAHKLQGYSGDVKIDPSIAAQHGLPGWSIRPTPRPEYRHDATCADGHRWIAGPGKAHLKCPTCGSLPADVSSRPILRITQDRRTGCVVGILYPEYPLPPAGREPETCREAGEVPLAITRMTYRTAAKRGKECLVTIPGGFDCTGRPLPPVQALGRPVIDGGERRGARLVLYAERWYAWGESEYVPRFLAVGSYTDARESFRSHPADARDEYGWSLACDWRNSATIRPGELDTGAPHTIAGERPPDPVREAIRREEDARVGLRPPSGLSRALTVEEILSRDMVPGAIANPALARPSRVEIPSADPLTDAPGSETPRRKY